MMDFALPGGDATLWGLIGTSGAVVGSVALWQARRGSTSAGWPRVIGNVISSEAPMSPATDDGPASSAYVRYRYEVGGREYRGDRLRFGSMFGSSDLGAQSDVLDYRPGRTVQVAYNPDDPSDSVLEPGAPAVLWIATIVAYSMLLYAVIRMWTHLAGT